MKRLVPFLLIYLLIFPLRAQFSVPVSVESSDFKSVAPVYIRVRHAGQTLFFRASTPVFRLNLQGKTELTIAAPGHNPVKASFVINNSMPLGFILDRPGRTMPYREDVLLDAMVTDSRRFTPVASGTVTVRVGNRRFRIPFRNGRFQLRKDEWLPLFKTLDVFDTVEYLIEAPGYKSLYVTDRLPLDYTIKNFRLEPVRSAAIPSATRMENPPSVIRALFERADTLSARPATPTACDRLPRWIRVGINCNCNDCRGVLTMTLETYVQKGLNDEWIASWHIESLKAGTLPYRTYGAYYVYHPINDNYDISNTTCKQVWDDDQSTACTTAAEDTQGQYLETAGGAIAFSEYSAENNCLHSTACTCGDGYSGNGDDWPCIEDEVCRGHDRYGHGRGMCQWGSQRWASGRNKTYDWINDHYYNPGHYYRCGTEHPHPDWALTAARLERDSLAPGEQTGVVCTLENPTSYRPDKSLLRAYLSADETLDESDRQLAEVTLWPLEGGASVDKNFDIRIPGDTPDGSYYVLVVADPDNKMYETDEQNNLRALPVVVSATAVGSVALLPYVSVYPNPAEWQWVISTKNGARISRWALYSLTGRLLSEGYGNPRRIMAARWPAGIYLLRIELDTGISGTFRLVKK